MSVCYVETGLEAESLGLAVTLVAESEQIKIHCLCNTTSIERFIVIALDLIRQAKWNKLSIKRPRRIPFLFCASKNLVFESMGSICDIFQ